MSDFDLDFGPEDEAEDDGVEIDLDFRPEHYGDFDDPVALALNGIKGQMRRAMVRDRLEAEGARREAYDALLGPVEEGILEEQAPAGFTDALNEAYGPSWLGGEYLPDLRRGEVEIARIVLQSVTMDVYSVRARRSGGRYHYVMKDEYGTDFKVRPRTSRRPLTLRQLIHLIETAGVEDPESTGREGFVEEWWQQRLEWGDPLEECTDFAQVESDLYPDLDLYYEDRAWTWREERAAEGYPWEGRR